ncbi:314_t:CDS:1, partial [Rhizophagus irregularis]
SNATPPYFFKLGFLDLKLSVALSKYLKLGNLGLKFSVVLSQNLKLGWVAAPLSQTDMVDGVTYAARNIKCCF